MASKYDLTGTVLTAADIPCWLSLGVTMLDTVPTDGSMSFYGVLRWKTSGSRLEIPGKF
jgi:hypothetical protein